MIRSPRRLIQTAAQIAGRAPLPDGTARSALVDRLRTIVDDPNVVGFAIAEKVIAGQPSGELGITFHVRCKQAGDALDPRMIIPAMISDPQGRAVFTDIVEVGDPEAHLNVAASPIRGGFSISHANGRPGTLGAIARKGGAYHLLSAQHVLANEDQGVVGDDIVYPAKSDGGQDVVARLKAYAPLDPGGDFPNVVDAALAELIVDPGRLDTSLLDANRPLVVGDAADGMEVALIGRTSSAERQGRVTGRNAHAKLYYPQLGILRFRNQVACTRFGESGDSGALVIDVATKKVVGLHIGGAADISWFTPIRIVLATLGAKLAP